MVKTSWQNNDKRVRLFFTHDYPNFAKPRKPKTIVDILLFMQKLTIFSK